MKLLAVYPTILLFAIFGILPAMLYAGGTEIDSKPVRINAIPVIFQDSIPIRKGGDKKEQDRPAADTRPNGTRPNGNRPGENRPVENRPVENRPGENRPEEIRRIKEINAENARIREKSEIKQVPRSIPKLKPKAVKDRVPIRRPPMRIPKKGVGAIHF